MTRKQQISHNLNAVENAVAQQTLEGLKVPPDVVEEMKRAARGVQDFWNEVDAVLKEKGSIL